MCAYLVNSRYYPQLAQQMSNDEHSLEDGWQPLLRADKWLACYPSICYQRPGFSDIEKKTTDNIIHYFNKLPVATKPSTLPITDTIGFFMETSFHYALYRPIITALQAQGQICTLVINDRVFKPFLDEMLATLKSIDDPQLKGMRLSEMQAHGQRVKCPGQPLPHARAQWHFTRERSRHVRLSQRDVEPRRLEPFLSAHFVLQPLQPAGTETFR